MRTEMSKDLLPESLDAFHHKRNAENTTANQHTSRLTGSIDSRVYTGT